MLQAYVFCILFLIYLYIIEKKVIFIFNFLWQQLGKIYYNYFILVFIIFYVILCLNLLSLLPFGIALTSHLNFVLFISLSLCIGILILGLYKHGLNFLKIFIPACPVFLLLLLIIIEIFSYIIRIFSLAIRLVANIMAGHTLIHIISSLVVNIILNDLILILFINIFIGLILILECGVAMLQAYVFCILFLIYLNDSLLGGH